MTQLKRLLQWVRVTLPMDLDWPQLVESKIEDLIKYEQSELTTLRAQLEEARKERDEYAKGFAEWVLQRYDAENCPFRNDQIMWQDRLLRGDFYTTEQVFAKYQEHLKKKA